jgi:predicted alpha/beta-hydrolase family hydrolase
MNVTVYENARPSATLILAHGAGAGQNSPFMTNAARGLAERGVTAVTFDFPYMAARRKVPDRADVLEKSWLEAIDAARAKIPDAPLFIGGKSMGGRIASQVAAGDHPPIAGLVFLGYPLHPPGKPEQRRDAHLPRVKEPMLFIQGTRDPFGTADEIRALVPRLPRATLHAIDGGDHSFKVTGRPGTRPEDVMKGILDEMGRWMSAQSGT